MMALLPVFIMHSFLIILIRVLALCLMICAGALARKRGILDSGSTRCLAFLSTNFIYPAAIFASLVGNFTLKGILSRWALPAGTFGIMGIGFLAGLAVMPVLRKNSLGERRMFHFQSTVNNYVFLPLPLIMHAYGNAGVGLLSLSTIGSEIAVWTFGVIAISGGFKLKQLKNLLNMPMLAVALSIIVLALREYLPYTPPQGSLIADFLSTILSTAQLFGAGTVALSMIVAGSRMMELNCQSLLKGLQLFLVFMRLLIIPALCLGALFLLPIDQEARNILAIIAVMPCSVASVALSDFFSADTEIAAASVLLTHLIGILTIPFWMTFLP